MAENDNLPTDLTNIISIQSNLENERYKSLKRILWVNARFQYQLYGSLSRMQEVYYSALRTELLLFGEIDKGVVKFKDLDREQESILFIGLAIMAIGLTLPFTLVSWIGIILVAIGIAMNPYKRHIQKREMTKLAKKCEDKLDSFRREIEDIRKGVPEFDDLMKDEPEQPNLSVKEEE